MSQEFQKFKKNLYDELYNAGIITKKVSTSQEKIKVLDDYLNKLERAQSNARLKSHYLELIKKLYLKRYLIKEENIPREYFQHLSNNYLNEGAGHIDLANPDAQDELEIREMHVHQVIQEQKETLEAWLDYLLSNDANYIPMWAKVWAFQGMLKIGTLNKDLSGYNRRDEKTIGPFVSINSEILGKSVEYLKMHLKEEPENYPDPEIKRLASSESFYQIYGKLLARTKKIEPKGNEGIWVKYHYQSESDALKLYNDLQGYNTGWCTASSKETARNQVCGSGSYIGGDFYVYYSKDQDNKYKIPRIAIRMNKNKIGEIRGVAPNQNIEPDLEEILNQKLTEFPDRETYQKKVNDMRKLTGIYHKYQTSELTEEELRFIYEIDNQIQGFGYKKDPRINEILKERSIKQDLSRVFNCKEEEIGIEPESIEGKHFVYYKGNIDLDAFIFFEKCTLPTYVSGFLSLKSLVKPDNLVLPRYVGDDLKLNKLTNANGLVFPETIKGSLYLWDLKSAIGLNIPQKIGWNLILEGLESAEGLILPNYIGGSLDLCSLKSADGLRLPEYIGDSIDLRSLINANNIIFPQNINGSITLNKLENASGLVLPEKMGSYLILNKIKSAEGITFPNYVEGQGVSLNSLISTKGLKLPRIIKGELELGCLTIDDLLDVELPEEVRTICLAEDQRYSLADLKSMIAVKKEKQTLQAQKETLTNMPNEMIASQEIPLDTPPDTTRKGYINILLIMTPVITILLGLIIAIILYY